MAIGRGSWLIRVLSLLLVVFLMMNAAACSRRGETARAAATGYEVEFSVQPDPANVGPAELWVRVISPRGAPVDDAEVAARGDMSHPGMIPVFGEAVDDGPGTYRIPFEWTMAGDWIVTIDVELSDGTAFERRFGIRVETEDDS